MKTVGQENINNFTLKNFVYLNLYVIFQAYNKRKIKNIFFLSFNQNICCGYSKELSCLDGSFERPTQILKMMDKKIFLILRSKFFVYPSVD